MSSVVGSLTGSNAAKQQQQQAAVNLLAAQVQQQNQQNSSQQIDSTFGNVFTPEFYKAQRQNYLDYATPQLNKQYADAQKALAFSLDRAGMLNSSARSQEEADLQSTYDNNQQTIAANADQSVNSLRNNVESARSALQASLRSGGDVTSALSAANSQAAALSAAPTYSPLGDLFSTATSALAQQAAVDKLNAIASGTYASPYVASTKPGPAVVVQNR